MKRLIRRIGSICAMAMLLTLSGNTFAQTPPKDTGSKSKTKTASTPPPTDQEIADAKAKGQVWVNTSTKVYHKDGEYFGKTKQGKFMAEADARKAGYKAAKEPQSKKKPADTKK